MVLGHDQYDPGVGRPVLLQAALSHIELALSNLSSQAHLLQTGDSEMLGRYVCKLQKIAFAPSTQESPSVALEQVSDHETCPLCLMSLTKHAADIEEPLGMRSKKCLAQDMFLAAAGPNNTMLPEAAVAGSDSQERQPSAMTCSASPTNSSGDPARDKQEWLVRLIDVFDFVDTDRGGAVEKKEWTRLLKWLGISDELSEQVFSYVDVTHKGRLDRVDWLHMLESVRDSTCPAAIIEFTDVIEKIYAKNGGVGLPSTASRFILRPESPLRVLWDMILVVLLFYISLSLPYSLGFGSDDFALQQIDGVIDVVFMVDVALNFRTAYCQGEVVVMDGWRIASNYLKTWFLLDFMTCFPFEAVTAGLFPDLRPAKMMKIGKVVKVVKLLRITKLKTQFMEKEWFAGLMDTLDSKAMSGSRRLFFLMIVLGIACHWVACGMSVAGTGWIQAAGGELEYVSAFYWAMTTLTTVGYGDCIPSGTSERIYAILSMVVGGAFYGYMVGKLSSTVAINDRTKKAFAHRMGEMEEWLAYHSEMPKVLRHRIKRYFRKKHFTEKTITPDATILKNLSPALVHDVSFFLIPEEVRCNVLFNGLATSTLVEILPILERTESEAQDVIVSYGQHGTAMYIIVTGVAFRDRGHPPDPTASTFEERHAKELLTVGDCFGEEIILGMEPKYLYHICARTAMGMYSIGHSAFVQAFASMPEVTDEIIQNFMRGRSAQGYAGSQRQDQSSSSQIEL